MKVVMVDVISVNGHITRGDETDVRLWHSPEDAAHFHEILAAYPVMIMGRMTYELMRPTAKAGKLYIIMTREPQAYTELAVSGAVEFTNETPEQIIGRLRQSQAGDVMIAGGAQINAAFVAAGLATDIFLTIEPQLFGSGTSLVRGQEFTADLRLVDVKQLNARGTLLAHYEVIKGAAE